MDGYGKELIGGEEIDLLQRIGSLKRKIVYDPAVIVDHIIDAQRLEGDYFVAQAIGWGRTLALLEMRRSWPYQLLRVGNAFWKYIRFFFDQVNLSDVGPYGKKLAQWEIMRQKGFCIGRWKRLGENLLVREGALGE